MRFLAVPILAMLPLAAVADPMVVTMTADNKLRDTPPEWLGQKPHLVIMGFVNGFPFDLQILDLDEAGLESLVVTREYSLAAEMPLYRALEFELLATIEGVQKKIEGKLNHADFLSFGGPITLDLQDQQNPDGLAGYAEFAFQWAGLGFPVNEMAGDWNGLATVAMDTAFASKQPTKEGLVGGYIDAAKGENFLVMSYTLPVSQIATED